MNRMIKQTLAMGFAGAMFAMPALTVAHEAMEAPTARKADRADSTAVFWGFNGKEDAYFFYGGAVHALDGDLSTEGFLVRGFVGLGGYEYKNPGVAGGRVDADLVALDASIGYQVFIDYLRLSGYIGIAYEDNDLSPNDPGNSTRNGEVGVKLQGEVASVGLAPWSWAAMASYGSANNSYWARLRIGHNFDQFTIGPEGLLMGNDEYDGQRIGAFVTLPRIGVFSLSLSGGYADVDGTQGDSSAYGAIDMSTSF